MPISSLVLTLTEEPAAAQQLVARLERDRRITFGAQFGAKIPIVIEVDDREEERSLLDSLWDDEGVAHVDVVFVEVTEADDA